MISNYFSEYPYNNEKLFNRTNSKIESRKHQVRCIRQYLRWNSGLSTRLFEALNGTISLPITRPCDWIIFANQNETRKRAPSREQIQRKVLPRPSPRILNWRLWIRRLCLRLKHSLQIYSPKERKSLNCQTNRILRRYSIFGSSLCRAFFNKLNFHRQLISTN